MATATEASTKVITGEVRLSYVHLFQPYSGVEGADPKYSCVLLIPKSDKATMKKLRAAQQAALEQGKDKKFGGRIPKVWKDTIHDGDEDADLEKNPEYAGHWYVTVSSTAKPGIVDRNVQPILDASEVYSGCYARVSVNAYAFNTAGNKGVSFGLQNVQKLRDGEPLGGARARAEDDFDPVEYDDEDEDDDLV